MPASPGHQKPSSDEIRAELSRILESAEFVASNHLAQFLRYVVDESLAGRADSIKERNVAVHALQRDSTFNPRKDPIVRIVAGRLRRALTKFYRGNEAANSVRIELPKGAYRPRFSSTDVTQLRDSSFIASAGRPMSSDGNRTRRPVLVVVPFVAFSRGAFERNVADAIAQDMSVHLSRFSWFEVADFLTVRNLPSRRVAPAEIASRLHADLFSVRHDSKTRTFIASNRSVGRRHFRANHLGGTVHT